LGKSTSYNKLKAAKNRFNIYHRLEKLGLVKSIDYFTVYGLKAIIKYLSLSIKIGRANS
jgi:hypothetical protein